MAEYQYEGTFEALVQGSREEAWNYIANFAVNAPTWHSFHGMKVLTAGQATGTGLEVGAVFEVELERLTNMGGGDTRHLDVSLMKNTYTVVSCSMPDVVCFTVLNSTVYPNRNSYQINNSEVGLELRLGERDDGQTVLYVKYSMPDQIPACFKCCCCCLIPSQEELAQQTARLVGEGIRNGMQKSTAGVTDVVVVPAVMDRGDDDIATKLNELADMKAKGLLEESEFKLAKQKLLGGV